MTGRILVGDALERLRELPDGVARCCVTSPPYWGLRDYGTATWDGGREGCDHRQQLGGEGPSSQKQNTSSGTQSIAYREICAKCGARRIDQQLGLERTPDEYVTRIVEVFREVRRVLADDGTLWLNLGDCYATGAGAVGDHPGGGKQGARWKGLQHVPNSINPKANLPLGPILQPNRMPLPGLKPKDLVGIPWRVAFALQADGWWLRSEIIWAKPNPMPESVTDRPTKAHEQVFLLAKAERYYYDGDAIAEPSIRAGEIPRGCVKIGTTPYPSNGKQNLDRDALFPVAATRNKRSVWTVATHPFPEAHFATFPPALIEPCILAGSAIGDTVLDPFCGSGTTGVVAARLNRKFIGVELSEKYALMAETRIRNDAPLLNTVEVMP